MLRTTLALLASSVLITGSVGAGFKFAGQSHCATDTVIYNQAKDFEVVKGTAFKQERVEHREN